MSILGERERDRQQAPLRGGVLFGEKEATLFYFFPSQFPGQSITIASYLPSQTLVISLPKEHRQFPNLSYITFPLLLRILDFYHQDQFETW